MNQLALYLINLLPMEEIAKDCKEHIEEYLLNPSEDNRERVFSYCSMILTKALIEQDGVDKVFTDSSTMKSFANSIGIGEKKLS